MPPLFAAEEPVTLQSALIMLIVALATAITIWSQRREAKVAAEAAKTASEKVDNVHTLLNGTGITGALGRVEEWTQSHEKKDDERFAQLHHVIGMKPDEAPKGAGS